MQSTGVESTREASGAMALDAAACARLLAYLRTALPPALLPSTVRELRLRQFGHGQSNPTYLVEATAGGVSAPALYTLVLRKKPPGQLLASAHAVEREYAVLQALQRATPRVPVPAVYCLCTDASILGTPFYLMQHVVGRCVTHSLFCASVDLTRGAARCFTASSPIQPCPAFK